MPDPEVILNPNELSDILAKDAHELSDEEIDKLVTALRKERADHVAALATGKPKPRSKIKASKEKVGVDALDFSDIELSNGAEGEQQNG